MFWLIVLILILRFTMNVTTDSVSESTTVGLLSIGYSLLTSFIMYVQPLFNVLGVLENALIVIVFTGCLSSGSKSRRAAAGNRKDELATVSRIYYTLIALCEFFICFVGFFIRNTLRLMSLWVQICCTRNLY